AEVQGNAARDLPVVLYPRHGLAISEVGVELVDAGLHGPRQPEQQVCQRITRRAGSGGPLTRKGPRSRGHDDLPEGVAHAVARKAELDGMIPLEDRQAGLQLERLAFPPARAADLLRVGKCAVSGGRETRDVPALRIFARAREADQLGNIDLELAFV